MPFHSPARVAQSIATFVLDVCPPSSTIVDIGCGNALVSEALAVAGHTVIAVDPHLSSQDRRAVHGLRYVRKPIEECIEDLGAFDFALFVYSMHHLLESLPRIVRVCRGSGAAVIVADVYSSSTIADWLTLISGSSKQRWRLLDRLNFLLWRIRWRVRREYRLHAADDARTGRVRSLQGWRHLLQSQGLAETDPQKVFGDTFFGVWKVEAPPGHARSDESTVWRR